MNRIDNPLIPCFGFHHWVGGSAIEAHYLTFNVVFVRDSNIITLFKLQLNLPFTDQLAVAPLVVQQILFFHLF